MSEKLLIPEGIRFKVHDDVNLKVFNYSKHQRLSVSTFLFIFRE